MNMYYRGAEIMVPVQSVIMEKGDFARVIYTSNVLWLNSSED